MNLKLAPMLGVLATLAAAAPAAAVVNGTPVDPSTVPWFASVGGCGGTLVAPDRILTAAHCVSARTPDDLGAIAVGGARRTPTHIALHPGWRHRNGTSNFLDDVAVVQLDAPVTGVPLVQLGGVDAGEALILGRGRRFAPGTGHSEAASLDSTLRSAPLKTISDAACARAFKGYRGSASVRLAVPPIVTRPPVVVGAHTGDGSVMNATTLPSVFADVALYRGAAAVAAPALTCRLHGYVPQAGATIAYGWAVLALSRGPYSPPKGVGSGSTYRVAKRDRGHRVACFVNATNDGGFVTVAVANRLIGR